MSFGKLPGIPPIPVSPRIPTEAAQNLSGGPASTSVGVGIPQHFDPSNPSVQVSGTIHNPTGVGGDLTVSREVKIPTEVPNVNLEMPSMPSMGGASDLAPDAPSSGGGFGMPSIGNPLSGLSLPDMPSLGNPFSGFSAPTLPGGPLIPTLPTIGTPGMPGFRFLDLPSFTAPDLDMSPIDLVMPDWPFEWSDPIENSIDPDHVVTSDDPLWVKLHLISEDGADIPDVPFLVSACEDRKLEGTLDASGKKDLEVPEGEAYIAFPDLESVTRKCFANQLRHALESKDLSKAASLLVSGASRLEEIAKDFKKRFGKDLKSEFASCWTGSGLGSGSELLWEAVATKIIGAGDALSPLQVSTPKPDASASETIMDSIPEGTVYQASTPVAFFLDDSWGAAKEALAAQWIAIKLDAPSGSPTNSIARTWTGPVFGPLRLEIGFWAIVAQSTAKKEVVGQTIQVVERLDASNANDLAQLVGAVGEVTKVIELAHKTAEAVGDASEEFDGAEDHSKIHKDQLNQFGQGLKPLWESLSSHQGIQSVTATRFHGLASEPLCVFLSQDGTKWVVTDWTNPGIPCFSGQFASESGTRNAGEDPIETEKLIKQAFAKWASSTRYTGDALSWRVPLLNVDITSPKGPGIYFLSGVFSGGENSKEYANRESIEELLSSLLRVSRQPSSILHLESIQNKQERHSSGPFWNISEKMETLLTLATSVSSKTMSGLKKWLGVSPDEIKLPAELNSFRQTWTEKSDALGCMIYQSDVITNIKAILEKQQFSNYEKTIRILRILESSFDRNILVQKFTVPEKASAAIFFEASPDNPGLIHTVTETSNQHDWIFTATISSSVSISKQAKQGNKKQSIPHLDPCQDESGRMG